MRQRYYLYKRGKVYYAAFWDEIRAKYGRRVSTGQKSRAAARDWAEKYDPQTSTDTIIEYLESFWRPGSDYIKGQVLRGRSISIAYIKDNARMIGKYVRPWLAENKLLSISLPHLKPAHIERLMMHCHDAGIAPRRVNAIRQSVAVPLSEAERLGLVIANPAAKVRKLAEPNPQKGILTPGEVKAFFALRWKDLRHFAVNLLAASTGMRLGECLGLLKDNVHDDHIEVVLNWQDGEGLKPPKWNSERMVVPPDFVFPILRSLIEANPFQNDFVFFGNTKEKPMNRRMVDLEFNAACAAVGIADEDRRTRKLTFHSWRHWYNTSMRGKVADHTLRQLTGHRNEVMTDRYTHLSLEDRQAVSASVTDLFAFAEQVGEGEST